MAFFAAAKESLAEAVAASAVAHLCAEPVAAVGPAVRRLRRLDIRRLPVQQKKVSTEGAYCRFLFHIPNRGFDANKIRAERHMWQHTPSDCRR